MTIDEERPGDELDDDAIDVHVGNLIVVLAAIFKVSQGKPGSGSIDCPICLVGTVSYSIGPTKRAARGRCSTPGCIAFMS